MTHHRRFRPGFTFLEIMLVVLIIGILVSIVAPKFAGRTQQARQSATKLALRSTDLAMSEFELYYGRYPEDMEELLDPPEPPSGGEAVEFLDQRPRDPWNHALVYVSPAEISDGHYDLYSMGPNGVDDRGEGDDIPGWRADDESDL